MPDSLPALWLRGLAFNPAAPADVLTRLLDRAAGDIGLRMCEGRDLPGAVVDAAVRHPAEAVRQALARNQHVDPARLTPLATDPSGLVRARLASGWGGPFPGPRRVRPLPDDILVTLLTAQDGGEDRRLTADEVSSGLDLSRQIPLSFRRSLADRAHPELRRRAVYDWTGLTPAQRTALLHDPDPEVREAARDHSWVLDAEQVEARLPSYEARGMDYIYGWCALSPALVERCFADGAERALARNRHAPASALARLARHPDASVRGLVTTRPDLGPDLVAELRTDPDDHVRTRARLNPFSRTWTEYDMIHRVVGHGPDCTCPITEVVPRPSADWFAACAAATEPVLRRIAASWCGLPAELAARLARDEDEEVRIRLACHHPLAPPHLLLDVFLTRPDHRPHLLTLPAFPRTGTSRLIDHPDPQVRALAAADPALPHPPVDDPDASVRRAAATNPGLTPEALETLLADPHSAEAAASNPSLAPDRMRALLDHGLSAVATRPTPS
ncbi:hypothetical protein [Streptomyces sp. SGAir0957]